MPKNPSPHLAEKPPRTSRAWRAVRFVLTVVAVGPFLYEGALICHARWSRVLGHRVRTRTPVLDNIGQLVAATRAIVATQFQRVPWKPGVVLLVGIASCLVCMALLRGRGTRVE